MAAEPPAWIRASRDKWEHRGQARPAFALDPGPGQESVWDYPRPPAIVPDGRSVEVRDADGIVVAQTTAAIRVLETASPPTWYLPPDSVTAGLLVPAPGRSLCEWKGEAQYLALQGVREAIAWRYPSPYQDFFGEYANWVSFYPGRVTCTVDGELVRPQAGGFYGGWITDDVVGPFKGDPETSGW